MKQSTALFIVLFLALLDYHRAAMAMPAVNPELEQLPRLFKRSLCNTFGGCGAKRSLDLQQQQQQQPLGGSSSRFDGIQLNSGDAAKQASKYKNDQLINEVIKDLVEYLRDNERYRQGDVVVVVPKPHGSFKVSTSDTPVELADVNNFQLLR